MDDLQARGGCPVDVETILDILDASFQLKDKPEKQAGARRFAEGRFAEFLLLEKAGQPVGVIHIGPQWLHVGEAAILKGDVGHVGVRPEHQGKGYGTLLMQACVGFMRANGFHLSRLGGLMRFYSRFGYEPFPRRVIRIPVEPMETVFKGHRWSDIRAVPASQAQRVRPYHPARDHAGKHALLRAFHGGRSGAEPIPDRPGPAPAAEPDEDGLEFVYERDGVLCGYLKGALALVHAKAPTPTYCINTFAYDPSTPDACEALLKTFIWRAAAIAPTTITARIPFDEQLFSDINRAGISFEAVDLRQGTDGNMVQVINLPSLFGAIAPELERRLTASGPVPWTGCLRFALPGQEAVLEVSRDRIRPVADSNAAVTVETCHSTFLKWVFGVSGFAEFTSSAAGLSASQRAVLAVLFPRCACSSGSWG